jgi:transcriptional regulator with XRE-family HTH domain
VSETQAGDLPAKNYEHLGRVVLRWREDLGLSQREVAARGGPSDTTQSAIEAGEWRSIKPAQTLRKIDYGLQWPGGTARRVLFEMFEPEESLEVVTDAQSGQRFAVDRHQLDPPALEGVDLSVSVASLSLDAIADRMAAIQRRLDETKAEIAGLTDERLVLLELFYELTSELANRDASPPRGRSRSVSEVPAELRFRSGQEVADWLLGDEKAAARKTPSGEPTVGQQRRREADVTGEESQDPDGS